MNVIFLTHISDKSGRGISIDTKNSLNSAIYNTIFQDNNYFCDIKADYEEKTITFNDDKLEIPINNSENIILKSMIENNNINDQICSIYDETLKKGKPMQVITIY